MSDLRHRVIGEMRQPRDIFFLLCDLWESLCEIWPLGFLLSFSLSFSPAQRFPVLSFPCSPSGLPLTRLLITCPCQGHVSKTCSIEKCDFEVRMKGTEGGFSNPPSANGGQECPLSFNKQQHQTQVNKIRVRHGCRMLSGISIGLFRRGSSRNSKSP